MAGSPGARSSPGGRTGEQVPGRGHPVPGMAGVTDEAAKQKLVKKLSTIMSPVVSLLGTHHPTDDKVF